MSGKFKTISLMKNIEARLHENKDVVCVVTGVEGIGMSSMSLSNAKAFGKKLKAKR